jgi:hypothetical protein
MMPIDNRREQAAKAIAIAIAMHTYLFVPVILCEASILLLPNKWGFSFYFTRCI